MIQLAQIYFDIKVYPHSNSGKADKSYETGRNEKMVFENIFL